MTDTACQTEHALVRFDAGDEAGGAAYCQAIPSSSRRSECYFKGAEWSVRSGHRNAESAERAVVLCLAAEGHAHECLSHIADALLQDVPPASAPSGFAETERRVAAMQRALGREGQRTELGTAIAERLMASAVDRSFRRASAVSGDLLDRFPQRHALVRSAAAARLLVVEGGTPRSLDVWEERLSARLAVRLAVLGDGAAPVAVAAPGVTADFPPLRDVVILWDHVSAEDAAAYPPDRIIPLGGYNESVRITHEDARIDGLIALLEGAARLPRPDLALLSEGAAHAHPDVRWTAARLQAALH